MASLQDLLNKNFSLVKITNIGNIFAGGGHTLLLKPVSRTYSNKTKKPLYYLARLEKGHAEYLSGLFATSEKTVFSADYKDGIGLKHIVKVFFMDDGKMLKVTA